jgi:hypothetical protein
MQPSAGFRGCAIPRGWHFIRLVLNWRICYFSETMRLIAKHNQYIRLVAILIPLFLVFMGMRVPDLSRPHKPKPMRRAVLENSSTRTIVQSVVKNDIDPVTTNLPTIVLLPTEEYIPEAQPIYASVPLLSLSPFPPRAPPVTRPLA